MHRDVKSANVLIGKEFDAKLSDFGLAVVMDTESIHSLSGIKSVGTHPYMSPEAIEGVLLPAVDVYGFGMVCHVSSVT